MYRGTGRNRFALHQSGRTQRRIRQNTLAAAAGRVLGFKNQQMSAWCFNNNAFGNQTMSNTRRSGSSIGCLAFVVGLAISALIAMPAAAQTWPERPVKLIVPHSAGGAP